jgi:hypothetical protein
MDPGKEIDLCSCFDQALADSALSELPVLRGQLAYEETIASVPLLDLVVAPLIAIGSATCAGHGLPFGTSPALGSLISADTIYGHIGMDRFDSRWPGKNRRVLGCTWVQF